VAVDSNRALKGSRDPTSGTPIILGCCVLGSKDTFRIRRRRGAEKSLIIGSADVETSTSSADMHLRRCGWSSADDCGCCRDSAWKDNVGASLVPLDDMLVAQLLSIAPVLMWGEHSAAEIALHFFFMLRQL